jgi:crotonyl-CoA reductase
MNLKRIGKVGVLCMAPEPGLGVTSQQLRGHIGEDQINLIRNLVNAQEGDR